MAKLELDSPSTEALALAVQAALQRGERFELPGLGTFTTCTRKAAPGRPACTIAMWRAHKALRAQLEGGEATEIGGPHQEATMLIVDGMQSEEGVHLSGLGSFRVVRSSGKKPRLVFHADAELNEGLNGQ